MDSSGNLNFRDPSIEEFDTTIHLAHAAKQAAERNYDDFLIVDVDCHHYETESFAQIIPFIEDPVIRYEATQQGWGRPGIATVDASYQKTGGRFVRYNGRHHEKAPPSPHRDITVTKRFMDAMGVDYACLFPTPMLLIGMNTRVDTEVALSRAYNRWFCETVLANEPRIKSMLYLPFNDPVACLKVVEEFGDKKGVIGFMVTAPHYKSVHDNAYVKTYAALEERGLPLAFHSGFHWGDQTLGLTNRFMAVHALGFTFYNMVHLTNWIVNGMPERFPKLKLIWIESGLAWLPFLIQRLDNEYMMRTSDAPLLKRKPGAYIRDMYFTSQPIESVDNLGALRETFKMISARTQLLYSSDYPHWDMDLPNTIYDIPFLSEEEKRSILGENARRLFNLDPTLSEPKLSRRAQRAGK